MPMHRKNTARADARARNHGFQREQPWFRANVRRQRRRRDLAAISRRRNRSY